MTPRDEYIRLPDRVEFERTLGQVLTDLWVSEFTPRTAPGPIDYSRGITLPADLIGQVNGDNFAAAFAANPWRDRFTVTNSPIGFTNAVGATIPADLTVAEIVANVAALKAKFGPPEPEQVIITPSLDALRAVVPFDAPNAIQRRSPNDFRTPDGIRVVVTKLADRPRLVPASWLQTKVVDGIESFLDQLDAIADSPEPIIVVEGPPDAAPTP